MRLCPENESAPAVTVRMQDLRLALLRVFATHVRPALRPLTRWKKLKLIDDCSLSEN
jgi:hypothetical protein